MVHLQVDGRVHDRNDQTFLEGKSRGVHKLQKDGKALGVYLWIQTDCIKVALVGVSKDGVEQPTTIKQEGKNEITQRMKTIITLRKTTVFNYLKKNTHLHAMSTVLCARNCCLFTRIVTSVRMSLLRSRFRLNRTSLAWRVNCMQLSAAQAILSSSANRNRDC